MKHAFTLAMLFSVVSAHAAVNGVLEASKSESCDGSRFTTINKIYDLEKVSESDSEATFEFKAQFGTCIEDVFFPFEIQMQKKMFPITESGLHLPWNKEAASSSISSISEKEVLMSVTVNKDRAFKRKSSKKFIMTFWPTSNVRFLWDVKATNEAGETSIDLVPIDPELTVL